MVATASIETSSRGIIASGASWAVFGPALGQKTHHPKVDATHLDCRRAKEYFLEPVSRRYVLGGPPHPIIVTTNMRSFASFNLYYSTITISGVPRYGTLNPKLATVYTWALEPRDRLRSEPAPYIKTAFRGGAFECSLATRLAPQASKRPSRAVCPSTVR